MRINIIRRIETPNKSKRIFLPAVIAFILTLVIPSAIIYLKPRNSILLLSWLAFPFWMVLLAVVVWHFRAIPENVPAELRKIDWAIFLCGILVFIAGWLPMGLWAYGVIAMYTPALIISIGSGLAVLAIGIFWLRQLVNAQ